MVAQEASPQLIEKVKSQLENSKKVNTNMTKMLGQISNQVVNFKALDQVVQKPEVLILYGDLDYS